MRILTVLLSCAGVWVGVDALKAHQPPLERYRYEQMHMGMTVGLVLYSADSAAANLAADAVFARFKQLDATLSDYDPESELSRLSATAGSARAVPISDDLWIVLTRAQRLAEETDGAFDVTVGPLVKLWRRAKREKELPSPARLAEARAAVGYKYLQLRPPRTAALVQPGMKLDLGGIAAGYAVDAALQLLRERGITRAMVDASGDIGLGDPPPGKAGWRLGVVPRGIESGKPLCYVELANAAITTSGDAYQYVEIAGSRYAHIVDSHTGLGLTNRCSATVIAPDCITADSVATALCVLGPAKAIEFIEPQPELAAMITSADPAVGSIESSRFKRFVAGESPSPER